MMYVCHLQKRPMVIERQLKINRLDASWIWLKWNFTYVVQLMMLWLVKQITVSSAWLFCGNWCVCNDVGLICETQANFSTICWTAVLECNSFLHRKLVHLYMEGRYNVITLNDQSEKIMCWWWWLLSSIIYRVDL